MRQLILKTAISLDGFLEGPDGAMDWFHTDDAVWQEEVKLFADVDSQHELAYARLFNSLTKRCTLKRMDAKPLPSGAVWLSYKA